MSIEPTCGGQTPLKDKRVLVVEDEAIKAMLVVDNLLEAGAEVVGLVGSVGNALQLIEAAGKGGLSAAVLDINQDGKHVSPVANRLAALGVPFLFATGYDPNCATGWCTAVPVLDLRSPHPQREKGGWT